MAFVEWEFRAVGSSIVPASNWEALFAQLGCQQSEERWSYSNPGRPTQVQRPPSVPDWNGGAYPQDRHKRRLWRESTSHAWQRYRSRLLYAGSPDWSGKDLNHFNVLLCLQFSLFIFIFIFVFIFFLLVLCLTSPLCRRNHSSKSLSFRVMAIFFSIFDQKLFNHSRQWYGLTINPCPSSNRFTI